METLRGASSASSTISVAADSTLWTDTWAPEERVQTASWLLRASGGVTSRANSAVPRRASGIDPQVAMAELEEFYRARELRPRVQLPRNAQFHEIAGALSARRYTTEFATLVQEASCPDSLARDVESLAQEGLCLQVAVAPTQGWRELYLSADRRGNALDDRRQLAILTRTPSHYLELTAGLSSVGVARFTVIEQVAALSGMIISADQRGRGLGSILLQSVMAEASARGCSRVALQVTEANVIARRLYASSGFRTVDSYEYRVAPD